MSTVLEEASATSSRNPTAVTELHSISSKAASCNASNAYSKLIFLTNHRITQPGKAPLQAKQAACPRNPACTTPTNQTSENTLTTHETTLALGRIRSQRICLISVTTGVQYIASPSFCSPYNLTSAGVAQHHRRFPLTRRSPNIPYRTPDGWHGSHADSWRGTCLDPGCWNPKRTCSFRSFVGWDAVRGGCMAVEICRATTIYSALMSSSDSDALDTLYKWRCKCLL